MRSRCCPETPWTSNLRDGYDRAVRRGSWSGRQTFLDNHAGDLVAIAFFTIPTIPFRSLFVLVVVAHNRRSDGHLSNTRLSASSPETLEPC
ncbi:MAG: hypothetical protein CME06_08880 [Gemmatimonadetes bacterium]|nr:hypothetical protein [Gemmatimonadota bacterium]